MKKILVCLSLFLLLAVGCTNTMNTHTKKVEELLGKYQKMDSTPSETRTHTDISVQGIFLPL